MVVADGILVGTLCLGDVADAALAFAHHKRLLGTALLVLGLRAIIGFLKVVGGLVVFAQSIVLVSLAQGRLHTASRQAN